jgi:hypothetical protein
MTKNTERKAAFVVTKGRVRLGSNGNGAARRPDPARSEPLVPPLRA